jgi:hypothetical protein
MVRDVLRVFTVSTLMAFSSALLAAGVAGCGSGGEQEQFTAADARRLANVRPVTPGWSPWPQRPEKQPRSDSSAEELAANDPIYAAYRQSLHGIREGREESNRWRDHDKLGSLTAQVFDTPANAQTGFAALNQLSRGYAEQYGDVTRAEEVDGLGDDAWVLLATSGARQATYHWRRANLVVEAHIDCHGTCPSDVGAAARAWADAIDEEARAGS